MSYNYDKVNLVEGSLNQIDDAPRYPLGTRVHDATGREYVYVKATASLTPGTAVAGVKRSATTVVSSSAFDGGFKISASTPTLATTGFNANELKGTLVKITRSGTAIGLFPITEAEYDGTNYVCHCSEVKSGDTVAFGDGAPVVTAGGTASTKAGAINVVPISPLASGKYGFAIPVTVIAA